MDYQEWGMNSTEMIAVDQIKFCDSQIVSFRLESKQYMTSDHIYVCVCIYNTALPIGRIIMT